MHLPRVFAAIFLFFIVVGGLFAFILAPNIRSRRADTPATVTASLPSGTSVSTQDEVRRLTLSVRFESPTYKSGERAIVITQVKNPTRQTITAQFPDACTQPTLSAEGLAPSYQVCAQATTYVILKPGQSLTQTESLYLQPADADVFSFPPLDARVLRLRSGQTEYSLSATWAQLQASTILRVEG
jgi:hypothetical protein